MRSVPDHHHLPDFDVLWPPLVVEMYEGEHKAGPPQHAYKDDEGRQADCHTKVAILQAHIRLVACTLKPLHGCVCHVVCCFAAFSMFILWDIRPFSGTLCCRYSNKYKQEVNQSNKMPSAVFWMLLLASIRQHIRLLLRDKRQPCPPTPPPPTKRKQDTHVLQCKCFTSICAPQPDGEPEAYLPGDRVNGVQPHIQEDGPLAHVAEHLSRVPGGFAHLPWHVVQGVVRHDHCTGEDGHNATAPKVLCHQVGQVCDHADHADSLQSSSASISKDWQQILFHRSP